MVQDRKNCSNVPLSVPLPFRSVPFPGSVIGTGTETVRNGNGNGVGRDWERSGTGRERYGNGSGTGRSRTKRKGERSGTETVMNRNGNGQQCLRKRYEIGTGTGWESERERYGNETGNEWEFNGYGIGTVRNGTGTVRSGNGQERERSGTGTVRNGNVRNANFLLLFFRSRGVPCSVPFLFCSRPFPLPFPYRRDRNGGKKTRTGMERSGTGRERYGNGTGLLLWLLLWYYSNHIYYCGPFLELLFSRQILVKTSLAY